MSERPDHPAVDARRGRADDKSPWSLYDRLIAGVPDGVFVRDYCLGTKWSYVEADCGVGVAWTAAGGTKRTHADDLRGRTLRSVAALAKSWCFEEATLGIAALNAWYAREALLDPLGATYDEASEETAEGGRIGRRMDAFDRYRPRIEQCENARVAVVGHFPRVERIAEYAHLTVLERNCHDEWDTPDPACEYVLPDSDYAFFTGVTLINKTAPRLLQLARGAHVVMVGPSVVMSPVLFDWGAETLAGSIVADPDKTRFAVKNGEGKFFGEALRMCSLSARQEARP